MSNHQYLKPVVGQNKDNSGQNSILYSILEYVKNQDSLMHYTEGETRIVNEPSDTSTLSILSPGQESIIDEIENKYFVLLSEHFHAVKLKKYFSVLFQVEDVNGKLKFDLPICVELVLEDSLSEKNICVLGKVWTTGTALFKRVIIEQIYENVKIVVKSDKQDIIPFAMNVKIVY